MCPPSRTLARASDRSCETVSHERGFISDVAVTPWSSLAYYKTPKNSFLFRFRVVVPSHETFIIGEQITKLTARLSFTKGNDLHKMEKRIKN